MDAAVIILTLLPGVGKTTLGRALVARLREGGAPAELLDGDRARGRRGHVRPAP